MSASDTPTSEATPALRPSQPSLIYYLGRGICRHWTTQHFNLKVFGAHYIPRKGGVLIVSNHQSYLDPVLLACKIVRPVNFMAKSELFENRYFGWLITKLNAFPVRQGEGDVGAVRETIRRLQEGQVLNVFPEGTRSPDGELQPMQTGVGLIVRRAGVPVVPAVIDGSFNAWPRGRKMWRKRNVRVMFGPAMDLREFKGKEIVDRIDQTLRGMFEELRGRPHG